MATANNTPEVWKPVVGYENVYSVSDWGRVRRDGVDSLKRDTHIGKIMKFQPAHGYLRVGLRMFGQRQRVQFVHRVVAAAFLGPRAPGKQINHKDGNKANNRISNLEYVTRKENAAHAVRKGFYRTGKHHPRAIDPTPAQGERNVKAKLNQLQVRVIRRLAPIMTPVMIAHIFSVSPSAIHSIKKRKTWRHIM